MVVAGKASFFSIMLLYIFDGKIYYILHINWRDKSTLFTETVHRQTDRKIVNNNQRYSQTHTVWSLFVGILPEYLNDTNNTEAYSDHSQTPKM